MKPSTTTKKPDEKDKVITGKVTNSSATSKVSTATKQATGTKLTTTTGPKVTGVGTTVKKPVLGNLKEKDNPYLSTGGNVDDVLEEMTKAPSQTPKGAKFGMGHLRTTSENFKADPSKLGAGKKETTPFNVGATASKPSINQIRMSIKKNPDTTKEFDLSSSKKPSTAELLSGYQNTNNSDRNNDTNIEKEIDFGDELDGNRKNSNIHSSSLIDLSSSPKKSVTSGSEIDQSKLNLIQKENDINMMKNFVNEKKQFNEIISKKNVEVDKLKKEYYALEKDLDQLSKDYEDLTNSYNTIVLEKDALEVRILGICKEKDQSSNEVKDLTQRIGELELDLEIKAEEMRIAQEEFEAYKIENMTIKKKDLSPESIEYKLIDLENQNKILTSTLLKLNDEKKIETDNYKKQIEDLKQKTKILDSISAKDEEIRIFKEKNFKYENVIIELKEQINAFASSSEMLDKMVIEKHEMEYEISELKEEVRKLKEDLETTDELIVEYEKINDQFNLTIRKKDDEILRLNNQIKMINESIEENDKKQKKLLDLYNKSQTDIKILKEEISKNNNNVNVEDIVNANNSVNSKIKTLERQTVLRKIYQIQEKETSIKSNIIFKMIPKKIFTKISFDSFEKFLGLFALKKKTLNLIFNLFENDLLDKERDILAINEIIISNKIDEIELENSKTLINFLYNLVFTLIDFYLALQTIEIYLSSLNSEEFKETKNAGFWNYIQAATLYIENLVVLIKEDNFSVKYQFESLKTISGTIKEEFARFKKILKEIIHKKRLAENESIGENGEKEKVVIINPQDKIQFDEKNYPIIQYTNYILNNLFLILIGFKKEREVIYSMNKTKINEIIKELNGLFNLAKKNIDKFEEKFLLEIPYQESQKVFEVENNYFLTILQDRILLENPEDNEDQNLNKYDKYANFSNNLNKVLVYVQALLEKYEKEKEKSILNETEIASTKRKLSDYDNDDFEVEDNKENEKLDKLGTKYNPILPVPDWDLICRESYQELESNIKLRDDLKNTENNLKAKKIENIDLKNQINDLKINLTNTQRVSAEKVIIEGKLHQLERDNEDYKNKLKRYEDNSQKLLEELNLLTTERNQLLSKVDEYMKNPQIMNNAGNKSRVTTGRGRSALMSMEIGTMNNDTLPLINTINQLQRERKLLKTKLVKDKFISIINTDESFVNKIIEKTQKKDDFEQEVELYEKIEEKVESITKKYNTTRGLLSKPKIYDLSSKDYNYNNIIKSEVSKTTDLRLGYLKDIDNILSSFFSDGTTEKCFKDVIDNDISKTIQYFAEPKLLVGRISIKNKTAEKNEKLKMDIDSSKSPQETIPLYLSEKALKYLNKSFMC